MKLFKKNWRGVASILIFVLCVAIIMTVWLFQNELSISIGLGTKHSGVSNLHLDTAHFKYPTAYTDDGVPSDEGLERLLVDEYEYCVAEEEEGAVLLMNNGALPLASNENKVSLLGHAAAQPLYRARSGGAWTDGQQNLINFHDAMTGAGYQVNETVYEAYTKSGSYRGGKNGGTSSPATQFLLGEEPASFYTDAIKNSFDNYNDAAIIVFAREGGETRDLPVEDYEGIPHLRLHKDEKDLLNLAKSKFDKIIVLLNTTNVMEVGELEDYGVDACMWIGGPGLRGFEGVANLIKGTANPSGRLVSTYATNSLSAPAMVNFGDIDFANADEITYADQQQFEGKLVVYAEGIYQGYKYYETRYEDCVLGVGGANSTVGSSDGNAWSYAKEVSYPFGHGLSYTTFTETLDSVTYNPETDEYTVTVTVQNTGSVAGKRVVEVYAQTPYGEYEKTNLVEKSAVQLAGFGKTSLLDAGATETLTITIDRYLLASYDYKTAKTYYLSEGDYYFAIGDDVHDALNNILAKKGQTTGLVNFDGTTATGDVNKVWTEFVAKDVTTYSTTKATGGEVTNRFDDVDINYWQPNSVTYLTRNDWANTYPTATIKPDISDDMLVQLDGYTYEKPANAKKVSDFTQGVDKDIKFVDLWGKDYDDPIWEDFLNQLTIDDMVAVLDDNFCTYAVYSVAKPEQLNNDGPDGCQQSYLYGDRRGSTCYPIETILSSSFNLEFATKRGEFMGEDHLYNGQTQDWAPAADIQRTPYSGRNYEYYSEDATVHYYFLAKEVKAMQDKGVNVAPKHFCTNDQEANRYGICTFMTEQTLRESCMRGFEAAFTLGGALGVMTSYSRIGCTYVGHSTPLQVDVLEGEWGFKGVIICDAVCGKAYQHPVEMVVAGNDMFCINIGEAFHADNKVKNAILDNDDGYLLERLRDTNKQFYYSFVRSNLVNGLDHDSIVYYSMPWWEVLILSAVIVLGICTLGSIVLAVLGKFVFNKEEN